MANITEIILITSPERPNVDKLSMAICGLSCKECAVARNKALYSDLFAWSMKNFDTTEMLEAFSWIHWESPESVVLLIDQDDGDGFKVHRVDMEEWKRRGWL